MGARSKSQCLRHNLDEIDQWPFRLSPLPPPGGVGPLHSGRKKGVSQLKVPRMPAFQCVGRRDHWLGLDPQTFRSWAMTPLALTLGLSPPHHAEAARVPKRARVQDVIHSDSKSLPPHCIYVGRGPQSPDPHHQVEISLCSRARLPARGLGPILRAPNPHLPMGSTS